MVKVEPLLLRPFSTWRAHLPATAAVVPSAYAGSHSSTVDAVVALIVVAVFGDDFAANVAAVNGRMCSAAAVVD
jgi:hypothetical protein